MSYNYQYYTLFIKVPKCLAPSCIDSIVIVFIKVTPIRLHMIKKIILHGGGKTSSLTIQTMLIHKVLDIYLTPACMLKLKLNSEDRL